MSVRDEQSLTGIERSWPLSAERFPFSADFSDVAREPYAHLAAANGFLRATFTLLGTDEGGRKSAVFGDYRPNWSVGVADPSQQSGARVVIDGAERIEPGGSADVRLFPLWPEFWAA